MAKIAICGDAAVITSGIKVEALNQLKMFKPEKLKLIDPQTKDEIFAIGIGRTPNFSKFGVTFSSENDAGFAQLTMGIPAGLSNEEKMQNVKEHFGHALLNLNKIEAQIDSANDALQAEFATIEEAIEIIG